MPQTYFVIHCVLHKLSFPLLVLMSWLFRETISSFCPVSFCPVCGSMYYRYSYRDLGHFPFCLHFTHDQRYIARTGKQFQASASIVHEMCWCSFQDRSCVVACAHSGSQMPLSGNKMKLYCLLTSSARNARWSQFLSMLSILLRVQTVLNCSRQVTGGC